MKMNTDKEEIFEKAKELFYKNGNRKDVVEFINSKGILGEEGEKLATDSYKSVKGKIRQAVEIKEHKSYGGPFGKIAIGLFAVGLGLIGIIAFEKIYFLIFVLGFGVIGNGVIGLFKNPTK